MRDRLAGCKDCYPGSQIKLVLLRALIRSEWSLQLAKLLTSSTTGPAAQIHMLSFFREAEDVLTVARKVHDVTAKLRQHEEVVTPETGGHCQDLFRTIFPPLL